MVRPHSGDVAALAAAHGVSVIREVGRSGFATIEIPTGLTPNEFVAALRGEADAARNGVTRGASSGSVRAHQWHLDVTGTTGARVPGVVVAVLDTGVAYEDYADAGGTYAAAGSLKDTEIVAPADLVNSDSHANDDHQHGTHIASIIASQGDMEGVSPGVALIPIKVLDAHNTGTEIDLIDGIYHAVDHGADVINMSLSFRPGFVPSPALLDAIAYASQMGVVMVAAAGNDALDQASWPAAHREVIGVAAGTSVNKGRGTWAQKQGWAPYATRGPSVDVVAPGGRLDQDVDGNGNVDGILAESFALNDPTKTGMWMMAGSSQAAAVVSGAAAHMVARGADPGCIRAAFTISSTMGTSARKIATMSTITGTLDLPSALELADNCTQIGGNRHYAVIKPYLVDKGGGSWSPGFLIRFLDESGNEDQPEAYGTILSSDGKGTKFTCARKNWNTHGVCKIEPNLSGGAGSVWGIAVNAVKVNNKLYRPGLALYGTGELEAATTAMASSPDLDDAVMGIHVLAHTDAQTQIEMAESYVVLNGGTGIATSPFGIVMPPPSLPKLGDTSSIGMPLGASTQWGDDTLSAVEVVWADLAGSGIATSPFGFIPLPIGIFDGSGIATSPFGFAPIVIGGLDPVGESAKMGTLVAGTSVGERLALDGWVDGDGSQPASVVAGSAAVDMVGASVGDPDRGTGAVAFVP